MNSVKMEFYIFCKLKCAPKKDRCAFCFRPALGEQEMQKNRRTPIFLQVFSLKTCKKKAYASVRRKRSPQTFEMGLAEFGSRHVWSCGHGPAELVGSRFVLLNM